MHLYCFYFNETQCCKIGISENLHQRASAFRDRYGWPDASSLTLYGDSQTIKQLESKLKHELWSWQSTNSTEDKRTRSEFFEAEFYLTMRKRLIEIALQNGSLHLDSWGAVLIDIYTDIQDNVWALKCGLRDAQKIISSRAQNIPVSRKRQ